MAFSLIAFGGAAFLELRKKSMDNDEKITALTKQKDDQFSAMVKEKDAKIAEIADKSKQTIASISGAAHSLDSALSSKFKAEINQLPESSILRILADSMCNDVTHILKEVGSTETAQCTQ
jgi:hypothetical protein